MRRLIAHISLAFTALVAVGATFTNVLTQTNSNLEYQSGREITFKICQREDVADAKPVDEDGEAVKAIADEMVERLGIAKVTSYSLATSGNDTVKLTLSQEKEEDYQYIAQYLMFNGNLALSFGNDYIEGSEFLTSSKATIETYNEIPCIVIPVNTESSDYKSLVEKVATASSEADYEFAEEQESGETDENGNAETEHVFYLYLWYDFVEGKCTFEASQDSSDPYSSHVLMKFLYDEDENKFYFPGSDTKDKLFAAINLDRDSDGTASVEEKEVAYKQANYYVNLINASSLDYTIKVYFDQPVTVNASIESLIGFTNDGNHLSVAWSSTFAATLCAILILTFLLIVYYRLGALSISTTSIVSTFVGLVAVILFKAEFNTFGVIGLALVAITSIISGGIYAHKLKEECYRGRSLKKANAEAAKKSLLPIVDVNVITIVMGVFLYIFGGALLRNFAVITVFGGLASIILNTLGLRGMYWLSTNATCLQGKYEAFGVNSELVPNIINEEKQTFFGAYADKDLTANKKPVGIVAGALLLASVAGLAVFGGLETAGKGLMYQKGSNNLPLSIYFETTNESSKLAESDSVKEILSKLMVYEGDDPNSGKVVLGEYVDATSSITVDGEKVPQYSFTLYTRADTENEIDVTYYIYVVNFNRSLSSDAKVALITGGDGTEGSPYVFDTTWTEGDSFDTNINALLAAVKQGYDMSDKTTITAKSSAVYEELEPEFGPVALGTIIALAVLGVYFILRYRLSRGLTAFIVSTCVSVVAVGLLTLLRFLAIPSYVVAAGPFVAAFTLMISVVFMNREREMIIEDKSHDPSVENRNEIMVKATSSAFGAYLPMAVFALYLGINFFGFGPVETSWIYIVMIIGIVLGGFVVKALFGPIAQMFYKLFRKIGAAKPKKTKKTKVARVNKSAEPEEAVFIGIND